MSVIAHSPLFFHAALEPDSQSVVLLGDEAAHAAKSRRLGPGDPIGLTNGQGLLATGTIATLNKQPVSIQITLDDCQMTDPPETEVVLATALPKGDRLNTLLDMATQMGIQAFQPLACARSTVSVQPKSSERWQRIIMSAAKQCRQTRFPHIETPKTVRELLAQNSADTVMVYGDPTGHSLYQVSQGIIQHPGKLVIAVGPEGGFDDEETGLLQASDATAVSAGPLILRTETAALALLSAVNQWLSLQS